MVPDVVWVSRDRLPMLLNDVCGMQGHLLSCLQSLPEDRLKLTALSNRYRSPLSLTLGGERRS